MRIYDIIALFLSADKGLEIVGEFREIFEKPAAVYREGRSCRKMNDSHIGGNPVHFLTVGSLGSGEYIDLSFGTKGEGRAELLQVDIHSADAVASDTRKGAGVETDDTNSHF